MSIHSRLVWLIESFLPMFTVRVPATIANMGPGFDSFGLAVSLYNQFWFEEAAADRLAFVPQNAELPDMGSESILFQAMDRLFKRAGKQQPPLQVLATAEIPMARGLGSSSTAIVAGLVAANQLLGNPFSTLELLDIAIDMEGHPDNVAPALLGGVVLCDTRPYRLPWPESWRILTLSPPYPVLTEEARRILPRQVSLEDSIFNLRKASVLTYALLCEDSSALADALADRLHQPYRRQLIREYDAIERAIRDAGALGMIISGSGSTMAIFCMTEAQESLFNQLQSLNTREGWNMAIHRLTVDTKGPQLLPEPAAEKISG